MRLATLEHQPIQIPHRTAAHPDFAASGPRVEVLERATVAPVQTRAGLNKPMHDVLAYVNRVSQILLPRMLSSVKAFTGIRYHQI